MNRAKPVRRGGLGASTATCLLLLLTLTGCGPATPTASNPATPTASAASTSIAAGSTPDTPSPTPTNPAARQAPAEQLPILAKSEPIRLEIPSIGLTTELLHLGLRENGSLEVPQDTGSGAPASWYNGSPTPGERGPSVMLGHVNALGGHKGVFADLRKLTPGDQINVSRADGSNATFTVDRGALYAKNSFPTLEVYGNTPGSELRLVTCDGYNPETGQFDDNYVIYAKLNT